MVLGGFRSFLLLVTMGSFPFLGLTLSWDNLGIYLTLQLSTL